MLKEYKYNILITSQNEIFNAQLSKMFPPEVINMLDYANNCALSRRMILERNYEILIVNTPLSDETGVNLAIDAAEINKMGVILFANPEKYNEYYDKVHEYGVLTLPNTAGSETFIQTLRLLCATRQRLQTLEKKNMSFSERMAEVRLISEAKLLLIQKVKLSEDEAHKYIERYAMNNRITFALAAKVIINQYKED
ncbi:MAG: ANTAR domain-containing protein [Acholeplasmatales bacterium]|nr:ANTAR domain-containing protein [Acholeplasmatales bacterium]